MESYDQQADYGPTMKTAREQSLMERIEACLSHYSDLLDQLEHKLIPVAGSGGPDQSMAVPTEAGAHMLDNQRVRLEQCNSRLRAIIDTIYL